jgi:NTE family protein
MQNRAQTHQTPLAPPRLALALSGGAARGFAHVGVLRAFERHRISIDMIAGTSAGAVVGGGYAAGISVDELAAFGRSLRWRSLGRLTISRGGLQSNQPMEMLVREKFPITRFEDLRIPFAAIATDLHSGAEVVMKGQGDVAFAIRASCSIPGIYVPAIDEHGRQLVDGGLVAIVPVAAARSLGADVVVAVDVNFEGAKFLGAPQSMLGVLFQSFMIVQRTATAAHVRQSEVAIRPRVGHIRWDEMRRSEELISLGEAAAEEAMPDVKRALAAAAERMHDTPAA